MMRVFRDMDDFASVIGIMSKKEIQSLLEKSGLEEDERKYIMENLDDSTGFFSLSAHSKSYEILKKLMSEGNCHIATETIEDLEDNSVEYTIDNCFRLCNRERFYLCSGETDPTLYYSENSAI